MQRLSATKNEKNMYFFIHLIFIRNNLKEKAKGKLIIIKEKTFIYVSFEGRLYF